MRSSYRDLSNVSKREFSRLTTKLSVALLEVSRLKIADSERVRSRTISLSKNFYIKALARLRIC